MSENVTPAQLETVMRNVVAEENYSITRTFYQIRKKNYIIKCDFIQDVLGPMMRSPKLVRSDADIKVAVTAWANPATRAAAEITYGHISDWETGNVTNMEKLFCGNIYMEGGDANMRSFNDDISRWDVSNVITMKYMFCRADAFNGDLSRWDTSKVTTMECMFCYAYALNGDLSRWDTSNVTTMEYMFNMLMPLMEILVDGTHPVSLLWSACSVMLMPLMEILVDGIHPM